MTREDENDMVRERGKSFCVDEGTGSAAILGPFADELADYSKLFARQHLTQQEADVYNDNVDIYKEGFETAIDLLGAPRDDQIKEAVHSVEGMNVAIVNAVQVKESFDKTDAQSVKSTQNGIIVPETSGILTLAAAGEAAVSGLMLQAAADNSGSAMQDDYVYYINDGVYSAFNNLMFDHAMVRPHHLKNANMDNNLSRMEGCTTIVAKICKDGLIHLDKDEHVNTYKEKEVEAKNQNLFASTVFGPTCDSIDVIARSVLLPELKIGEWLYFQNMGAYTMAAASCFNGFTPSERFYVRG